MTVAHHISTSSGSVQTARRHLQEAGLGRAQDPEPVRRQFRQLSTAFVTALFVGDGASAEAVLHDAGETNARSMGFLAGLVELAAEVT